MDEQLSDLLRRISRYVFIGIAVLLVLLLLLTLFRVSIGFWLWSTVETWATVRLGLDSDAAQLVTVILVSLITLLMPTLAWYFLWGKKQLWATGAVVGGQILIFLLVSTIGSGVCFDRQTGKPLCYYADIPGKGRVFSRTPGFDPVYPVEYKLYTREIALQSNPVPTPRTNDTSVSNSSTVSPTASSAFAVKNTPARFSSTLELLGSYEIAIPADKQWHDTNIRLQPMNQLQIGFVRGTEGNVAIQVGDVSSSFNQAYSDGTYYEYNLVPRLRNNRFDHLFKSPSTLKVRSSDTNVFIRVEVRQLF